MPKMGIEPHTSTAPSPLEHLEVRIPETVLDTVLLPTLLSLTRHTYGNRFRL